MPELLYDGRFCEACVSGDHYDLHTHIGMHVRTVYFLWSFLVVIDFYGIMIQNEHVPVLVLFSGSQQQ